MGVLQIWQRMSESTLAIGSLVFLIAYGWPIADPSIDPAIQQWCTNLQAAVWLLFAVDYLLRLIAAKPRLRFVAANWLDLLILGLPMLRPLRLLRAVSIATLFARRLTGAAALRTTVAIRTAVSAAVIWLVAALAVTDAERGHGGSIQALSDGMWWALTTMATVGYGDIYPTTAMGRLIAACLMLTGIAVLSLATAAVASWFVERMNETDGLLRLEQQEMQLIKDELAALKGMLERSSPSVDSTVDGITPKQSDS